MSFGVIAAVTTVASVGASYVQGKKATKAQAAASDAQRKINELRNNQQKRLFMADVRQALAKTTTTGIQSLGGGYESSRIQGQLSSEGAQRDVALDEFAQINELGAEYIGQMNRASRQSYQAQSWGQLGSFAGSMGGYDQLGDWVKQIGSSINPPKTG